MGINSQVRFAAMIPALIPIFAMDLTIISNSSGVRVELHFLHSRPRPGIGIQFPFRICLSYEHLTSGTVYFTSVQLPQSPRDSQAYILPYAPLFIWHYFL